MARPRSKIDITCQNLDCKHYLIEEGKDIVKRGKNRSGHQQYYCNHCHSWFVETKNTPFYHKHFSKEEIFQICELLIENNTIRDIERITNHHRDTIGNLLDGLSMHTEYVDDFLINEIKFNSRQVCALWNAVAINREKSNSETYNRILEYYQLD